MDLNAVHFLAAASDGRLFGLDQQTLISIGIMLFNACVLAVALTFFLYKPVRNFMRRRAEGIQAQITDAEENMAKAYELIALYEKKLEEIAAERIKVMESAHELAAEKGRQMLYEAENEVAAMKARAAAEIQAERKRVDEEIKLHIVEVASVMAEKFVTRAIDKDTQNRLFDETMGELKDTVWQN